MADPCTVVIGAPELLDSLLRHVGAPGEVLCFTDHQALQALDTIAKRRPPVVALERLFAATSRGAALINRIKTDPSLAHVEIRVMAHDGSHSRVSPRRAHAAHDPAPAAVHMEVAAATPAAPAPHGLDFTGTRRVPRARIKDGVEVQIDGGLARLIDLSTMGAQIVSAIPLKPTQKLRLILADDLGVVRVNASVAWASIELPKGVVRYRGGLEFKEPETKAIDAFCKRHQVQ